MNNEILITINGTNNNSIILPLKKLSHTIIFGSTGSGKSNLLHMLITNLIKEYSSDELKLALIDPKYIEFNSYKSLPHLFNTIARTLEEITVLLDDCLTNINNTKIPIIIIIDELAELTFNKNVISEVLELLNNDANSNIYLIMASQRPDLISKEIIKQTKTQIHFPCEYKLPKTLAPELKTISIKNLGEMIFVNNNTKEHMQTAYISDSTIKEAINNCKN